MFARVLVPLHRDGWKFVALFALVTAGLFAVRTPLGWAGVVLTLWCAYFFRDPPRVCPVGSNWVLSPADGMISAVQPAVPPAEMGLGEAALMRISIFMDVLNVHVNRCPCDGTVAALAYRPGRFFNASLDKASEHNERLGMRLATAAGPMLGVVQIAGLVARRIRCDAKVGDSLRAGQRYGLIRFGSRLDVYLPPGVAPLVAVGQTAVAGETVLADLASREAARRTEVS
ncbi:MAG TPA: phosphatidylserine decarboxylase [Dongiaceae bacterium]|nr:phosphatidylserine decarboxylase [Dongiaceae bacterium]